jgi:hypothetical protein
MVVCEYRYGVSRALFTSPASSHSRTQQPKIITLPLRFEYLNRRSRNSRGNVPGRKFSAAVSVAMV